MTLHNHMGFPRVTWLPADRYGDGADLKPCIVCRAMFAGEDVERSLWRCPRCGARWKRPYRSVVQDLEEPDWWDYNG